MTKTVEHLVKVEVYLTIQIDEDETDIEQVLSDMDYEFNVHNETDNAILVDQVIQDWGVIESKSDTFKI